MYGQSNHGSWPSGLKWCTLESHTLRQTVAIPRCDRPVYECFPSSNELEKVTDWRDVAGQGTPVKSAWKIIILPPNNNNNLLLFSPRSKRNESQRKIHMSLNFTRITIAIQPENYCCTPCRGLLEMMHCTSPRYSGAAWRCKEQRRKGPKEHRRPHHRCSNREIAGPAAHNISAYRPMHRRCGAQQGSSSGDTVSIQAPTVPK